MDVLDSTSVQELSDAIEKLTHSGQKTLDPVLLKNIKKICRQSDKYVDHAFHLISHELAKTHAEIRYSAFQICDELFRRSHRFRELVISDMRNIMDLTAETSADHPLPLPRSVALELKRLALKTMQQWNDEFGTGYKKLQIGFNFLKHCKKVDFSAMHNESLAEQARIRERERRQYNVNLERLKIVDAEIAEMEPEINETITAMQNCISLLFPTPEEFFITDDNEENQNMEVDELNMPSTSKTIRPAKDSSDSDTNSEDERDSRSINFRECGILNPQRSIQIELDMDVKQIKKTEANAAIIENAQDLHNLLNNRYLPCIKKWIHIISKATGVSDQLKKKMDLKKLVDTAVDKFNQLKLDKSACAESGSESSDSDFEEVEEKEGYEETVKEDLMSTLIGESSIRKFGGETKEAKPAWAIWSKENNEKDPTTLQSTLMSMASSSKTSTVAPKTSAFEPAGKVETAVHNSEPIPSTSKGVTDNRKTKLLAVAPKLPFDIDLYHWEDEHLPVPTMVAVFSEGSQFWSARPADGMEEIPVPDGSAMLRTRVIEYSGEFQPVKFACRAPLGNGKLCPRKDRYKCPFHGEIVPRDELGQCSRREDAERLEKAAAATESATPDWQDPQLLKELKAATGVDLTMPVKGKGGKKKTKKPNKYPGLTDIKAKQNTPTSRLSRKVFNKTTMKRISKVLDTTDHKRFRDKYGDQFHYMYNTA